MAVLDSSSPNAWALSLVLRITLTVGLISIVGIALARCFRHHAAARHFVLLVALVCALASPALAALFSTERLTTLVLTLPVSPRASNAASQDAEAFLKPTQPLSAALSPRRGLASNAATIDEDVRKLASLSPVSPTAREKETSPEVISLETAPPIGSPLKLAQIGTLLAIVVWGAGSLFLYSRVFRGRLRLRAARRSFRFYESGMVVEILEEARQAARGRRLARIAESDHVFTPIAAGLFRPVIVLPSGLSTTLKPAELRDVLVHEFAHIVRRDQVVIVLQAVAHVAYWPIWSVHRLNRLLANAREEVCDNYVLARQEPVPYGETLLRVAALSQNFVAFDTSTAILGWRGRLEDRIRELVSEHRDRSTHVKPFVAASLVAALVLATGALCGTRLVWTQGELPKPKADATATRLSPAAIVDTRAHHEVRAVEVNESERLRAPSSPAEKAVSKLMLVFRQDRARRAVYGVVLDAGEHSLIFTTSLATYVPDDLPPAIDATYLERAGKPAVEAIYDPHSNEEIFAYRALGHLSSYQFPESAAVAVGDVLDVATSRRVGEIRIQPHAAHVLAVNQEASVTLRDSKVRRYSSLIEIDGGGFDGSGFPEGTPFFKDGKLVGMTVVGTRFSKSAPKLSYLVPVERMAALYQTIKKKKAMPPLPEFPFAVPFELGETKFLNGDEITILEVRGTADTFATGNIYWIKGTYTLASHDKAELQASVTVMNSGTSTARAFAVKAQNLVVSQGTGTFTLFLPMSYSGCPHVSFYPVDGGTGFGGVYFGTGNSVHPQAGDRGGESADAKRIWDSVGLRLAKISRSDALLVTSKYEGGLQVLEVRADSPASRSGIQKNDVLVGLDRYQTIKVTDAFWILDHLRADEAPFSTLQFHVVRGGETVYGDLKLAPRN